MTYSQFTVSLTDAARYGVLNPQRCANGGLTGVQSRQVDFVRLTSHLELSCISGLAEV